MVCRKNKFLGILSNRFLTGRLNVAGTVMSKRALKQLVDEKHVRGWDDPRLYTLIAIRRRGVPPGAILSFINELGVTTATTLIQIARFEQSVRRYLETTVPRLLLVLDPVRVVIEDIGSLESQSLELPFSPKQPDLGTYTLRLTATVYIDRNDFREVGDDDFFRLSPGATVGLLHFPSPITAVSYSKDAATGQITEIRAQLAKDCAKPKAFIHWTPEDSIRVTVRVHKPLLNPITLWLQIGASLVILMLTARRYTTRHLLTQDLTKFAAGLHGLGAKRNVLVDQRVSGFKLCGSHISYVHVLCYFRLLLGSLLMQFIA
jgi:glutamyl/glutaminyl-tRNA synthetase